MRDCVIVYIWLPTDATGNTTNSLSAAADTYKAAGGHHRARVGHVAIRIIRQKDNYNEYYSFWPETTYFWFKGSKLHTYEDDVTAEGGREPDAKIPFFTLNVDKIIAVLDETLRNMPSWELNINLDNAEKQGAQNCATFVWKALLAGDIKKNYGGNRVPQRSGPPRQSGAWTKFKCQEGEFLGGIWDSFPGRDWLASPKLILHFTASAYHLEGTWYLERDTWAQSLNFGELDKCPSTRFITAAEQGDHATLKTILERRNANFINITDKNGWSALHQTAFCGRPDTIEFLLNAKANVNIQGENPHHLGWTPLHCAAWNYKKDSVKTLLTHGADTTIKAQKIEGSKEIFRDKTPLEISILNPNNGGKEDVFEVIAREERAQTALVNPSSTSSVTSSAGGTHLSHTSNSSTTTDDDSGFGWYSLLKVAGGAAALGVGGVFFCYLFGTQTTPDNSGRPTQPPLSGGTKLLKP